MDGPQPIALLLLLVNCRHLMLLLVFYCRRHPCTVASYRSLQTYNAGMDSTEYVKASLVLLHKLIECC